MLRPRPIDGAVHYYRKTDRQTWGQTAHDLHKHVETYKRKKTHGLCVPDAAVGVCMVPHISPRVGLWEPRCHFLSLQASANWHQISSRPRPITDACDEVAQIAISALFPKKRKKPTTILISIAPSHQK